MRWSWGGLDMSVVLRYLVAAFAITVITATGLATKSQAVETIDPIKIVVIESSDADYIAYV